MRLTIRPFHYADLDALIEIAMVSFAQEYAAQGGAPDDFAREIRSAARGRMIPLKLLTKLAGYRWGVMVAEVDGRVVGCGGYMGKEQVDLNNLMVHPDYRRRGIGQALLAARLTRLREMGVPLATASVLATNEASLANIHKQGFELFDQYAYWERPLPLPAVVASEPPLISRPAIAADRRRFMEIERQVSAPLWLEIQKSAADYYFPSRVAAWLNRFSSGQSWRRVFYQGERLVGFLLVQTGNGQNKGSLSRPVVADVDLALLPFMLVEAGEWLGQQGKQMIQLAAPTQRPEIAAQLEAAGWQMHDVWLRFVKRL
jgi:ribosomal protein S18 acetylase RimI-like enzyme